MKRSLSLAEVAFLRDVQLAIDYAIATDKDMAWVMHVLFHDLNNINHFGSLKTALENAVTPMAKTFAEEARSSKPT